MPSSRKLLPLQRPRGRALPPGLLQPTGRLAQCRQPGVELRVGGWPHRRHGQRGGPPALGQDKQQPWSAGAHGVPLRERGQLPAPRGGLGAQFRRAERDPVVVQHLKAPAAGSQHPARLGSRLRAQSLSQPTTGARYRRTTSPASGRHAEMTVGVCPTVEFQGHPPGQQVCLRHLARAQFCQRLSGLVHRTQQPARYRPYCVSRLN